MVEAGLANFLNRSEQPRTHEGSIDLCIDRAVLVIFANLFEAHHLILIIVYATCNLVLEATRDLGTTTAQQLART